VLQLEDRLPEDIGLLFNATTLGMTGQPALTLDLSPLPPDAVVFDAVYAPLETGLLRAAQARGLAAIDGLAMLIGQAAEAFGLFYGAAAPRQHDDDLRALLTR
jgi:shikimate dehydrogenase